ncbi:hypothetical protein TrST_g12981 [Triparma strigata]|uniref:Uncharacterized protein n=1 Tax=Triparma strigata TaxID=1606541 RepID=A0A9W7BN37_9STRA|nr:hypothetical protein TrST_g12981 [Triparma strigata]
MASWLDDSEDEGSDEGTGFVLATKTVQNVSPQSVIDAQAEIEAKPQSQSLVAVLGDSSEEEEEEEEESVKTVDGGKGEVTESQPSPPKAKPLTKEEKKALKAAEMDDLDALLNEFGVSEAPAPVPVPSKSPSVPQPTDSSTSKKKKKKKKKKATPTSSSDTEETSEIVDIKSVLASKAKKASSTPSAIAAAKKTAEEKKAKEKAKKAKKDKKGGERKKKDVVAHVGHSSNF